MVNNLMSLIGGLQPEHLLLIVVAIVLFFGGKKIPEMMRGLGSGVREFNNAKKGIGGDNTSSSASSANNNTNSDSSITDLEHESVK